MTPAAGEVHVHMRRSPAHREPAWEGRLSEDYIVPVGNHWYWNRYFSQACTVEQLRDHIRQHQLMYYKPNRDATEFRLIWPDGRIEEYPATYLQFPPVDI